MRWSHSGRLAKALRFNGALALLMTIGMWPPLISPAEADDVRDHRGPAARLEIVIHSIQIHDITESLGETSGEFEFTAIVGPVRDDVECDLRETSGSIPTWDLHWGSCMESRLVTSATIGFDSTTGEHQVRRTLPSMGDAVTAPAAVGEGVPVMAGQAFGFEISGREIDLLANDDIGSVVFLMLPEQGWGEGRHMIRGKRESQFSDIDRGGHGFGTRESEFSVEFEIRGATLPDLVANNVGLRRLDDGRDAACISVGNAGRLPSGRFDVSLKADSTPIPAGSAQWASLDPGQSRELCVVDGLPSGRHLLSLDVDLGRTIDESNERNNHFDALVTITAPPTGVITKPIVVGQPLSSEPGPGSAPERDLIVEKIQSRGEKSNTPGDCDPGDNLITVTIKNRGSTDVSGFTARLIIDGDTGDAIEQPVAGLAAGASLDLKFDDVKLKKGDHTLSATADTRNLITESKEDNNALTVSVTCKSEDD